MKPDEAASAPEVTDIQHIWMVGQGIHSWAMAGLALDPQTKADAIAFALGEIGSDEVVARTRARFGLE